MAAIGSGLELHWDERPPNLWLEEPWAVAQNVIDHVLSDKQRQEFVDDHPLVVPRRQQARAQKYLSGARVAVMAVGAHMVHRPIVELQERPCSPAIMMFSSLGIADQACGWMPSRSIPRRSSNNPPKPSGTSLDLGVIQMRTSNLAKTVDRVEIEGRRARIARGRRIGRLAEGRGGVERHVMIHELAHEGRASGMRHVVRVLDAEGRIGDQRGGTLTEIILGVQYTAWFADVHQRRLDRVRCGRKWRQRGKDAAERSRKRWQS